MPIIVRETWRRPASYEVEDPSRDRVLRAWFGRKTKLTGKTTTFPGFGTMRHSTDIGQDRSVLQLRGWPNMGITIRTRADINKWLKKLRPEEAELLEEADAMIVELHEKLKAMRIRRQAILADAWHRGHAVTWKELYEQAETNEAAAAAKAQERVR